MCSIYQFIYSNRENVTSPFPKLESHWTVDALNKIKEIKNKISSGKNLLLIIKKNIILLLLFFFFYICYYYYHLLLLLEVVFKKLLLNKYKN